MIFCGQPPAKNSQGRKGGENQDSSQVPRNESLKIFHHNIRGLGYKATS
jgi:hypothetical protein